MQFDAQIQQSKTTDELKQQIETFLWYQFLLSSYSSYLQSREGKREWRNWMQPENRCHNHILFFWGFFYNWLQLCTTTSSRSVFTPRPCVESHQSLYYCYFLAWIIRLNSVICDGVAHALALLLIPLPGASIEIVFTVCPFLAAIMDLDADLMGVTPPLRWTQLWLADWCVLWIINRWERVYKAVQSSCFYLNWTDPRPNCQDVLYKTEAWKNAGRHFVSGSTLSHL